MKTLTTISLFIFWAAVTAILTAGLVFYGNPIPQINGGSSGGGNVVLPPGKELKLTIAEVAKHSSTSDCWLIINNKVYNVTNYLSAHPGGIGAIAPYCGKEATNAFNTKNKGTPHSAFANSLLNQYYIGDFNQSAPAQQIQQNITNTNTAPPPAGGREDDD